jgi:phytanoyl-CoA hydroxylase
MHSINNRLVFAQPLELTICKVDHRLQMSEKKYDQNLAEFRDQGFTVFRDVLNQDLMKEVNDHVNWLQQKNPHLRPEQLGHFLMTDDPFWVRLVSDPSLLKIAEQFIGPNIALFASHYISKPPKDGEAVLWHQDGSYWPLDPMKVVTLWLAVDNSTPENGCMQVIPGTHSLALQELQTRNDVKNVLSSGIDESLVDDSKAVNVELRKGDVSVHHPQLVHGSKPNLSPYRRCGLTIRYIPTSTKITATEGLTEEGRWPSAFLLRGDAVEGVNNYNPWPKYVEGKHMPFNGCHSWSDA